MTYRSAVLSTFDDYLESECFRLLPDPARARKLEIEDRQIRLERFPFSVVLQVAYPELDYANRWCWRQFGPAEGECLERHSNYPGCPLADAHTHEGRWMWYWIAKTDYDFGFNEWCFARQEDRDRFLAFFPEINWGEKFPVTYR